MNPQDIDPETVLRSHAVAGALGSVVALRFAPGASWVERILNVAAGSACAGFFGPALAEWLELGGKAGMSAALAFGIGMFGLSLAAAVTQAIRDVQLAKIVTGWISRRE